MLADISVHDFIKSHICFNIIDMRSIEKFNHNHIPGAKNIQMEKLIANPSKYINRNETYYIYCDKGLISAKVAQILRKMGYQLVSINGGYEEWILEK
ncbi:MAG: rhodanese-like domain-containing protein [Bacilli bacterium]|nr:rhodanese-like domain-containing protein [Bacilli bacterium]